MPLSDFAQQLWRRYAAQAASHALIFLDPAGRVAGWGGAAREVFGYAEDEVLGAPGALLFTAEDLAAGLDRQEMRVARDEQRSSDDRWHVRKDGTRIWVSGTLDAVRDADGTLLGYVKVVRDRTDLRMRWEARESELADTRGRLQATLSFARTLGHEIRNPLAPLMNSAQILQRVSDDLRVHKAADIIARQVTALSRMAEDLMNATRMEAGQLELRLEALDLRPLLQDAVAGLAEPARERGVILEATTPEAPVPAHIDPPRIEQVLLNLLGNALKYTPRGGRVWCTLAPEGGEAVLRVRDTGIGIAPEVLPRIFDLFSRERQASEEEPEGLGVGLSIVHQLVRLHGGSVQARSGGHGQGSEFTVRLPMA